MNSAQWHAYLKSLEHLGSIPGLDTIRELLFRIHNPQNQIKVIHIAGTNGKGSVGAFLSAILQEAGFRIGRYTSPYVFDELEIISINGTPISDTEYGQILAEIRIANDSMIADGLSSATRFEVETAAAFAYFANQQVDYVLVECGMGGDLDATNVIDAPILSVITNISYDHMAFLGNTLSEIASHKAGIMKANSKAIAIHSYPESDQALSDYASKISCELQIVDPGIIPSESIQITAHNQLQYEHPKYGFITIPLTGYYQVNNSLLAVQAIRMISPEITMDCIRQGLLHTKWPGRFECIHDEPTIMIDGAHNPDGMHMLANSIRKQFEGKSIIFVIGVFADKDYTEELKEIIPFAKEFICIQTPDSSRALPAKVLAETIKKNYHLPVSSYEDIQVAIHQAITNCTEQDVIICCGSLSHLRYIKSIVESYDWRS